MLRLGVLKGNKKGKLEVQEDKRGILPILGPLSWQRNFCRNRVSLALCHGKVFRVTTGFLG